MGAVHGQRGMQGIQWQLCQSEGFSLSKLCLSIKRKHYVQTSQRLFIHGKPQVHHISRSQQPLCNACPCHVCTIATYGICGRQAEPDRSGKMLGLKSGWLVFLFSELSALFVWCFHHNASREVTGNKGERSMQPDLKWFVWPNWFSRFINWSYNKAKHTKKRSDPISDKPDDFT